MELPPGFRFHPTDEELITHYLWKKVLDAGFNPMAVGEVDLNKCEPWEFPQRSKLGEKEWYFFCVRDRKYPTGLRTNRATDSGYWKATGKDKEIYRGKLLVGMKKTLVFYRGRAPRGEKSNWVMHEYRLEGKYSIYTLPKAAKNEWVLCRVFKKSLVNEKKTTGTAKMVSFFGENTEPVLPPPALPPLMDIPHHVTCFSNATEGQKAQEPELLSASAAALQYLINPPFQFASANNPSVDLSPLFFSKFMPMAASHHPGGFVHLKQGYYLETEALDTRLTSDMNPDVTSEIEIGRSSFEHCSWNC
ncbi:hypothetical protein HPP92_002365 [Vanilla planifolia]|uniref:NAC domain-containing protein n=1 Tax=Vanilla planifolia TaxID=51239 RepID=A0A835RTA8_VANPL|nr:hypothetical protein HPP92_002365 [Vanilla planifolia]